MLQDEDPTQLVKFVCQQAQEAYVEDLEQIVNKEIEAQCKLFKRLYDHAGIGTVKTEKIISMQNGGVHIGERRCDIIINDCKGQVADLIVELKLGDVVRLADVGQVVDYMRRLNVQLGLLIYFPKDGGFAGSIKAVSVSPDSSIRPVQFL